MDSGFSTPGSIDSGELCPEKERARMQAVAAKVEAAVAMVQAQHLPALRTSAQSPDVPPETMSSTTSGRLSKAHIDEQFARYLGPADPDFVPEDKRMFGDNGGSRRPSVSEKSMDPNAGDRGGGNEKESYASKILRQKDSRDALTAAAEEKMARDAERAAQEARERRAAKGEEDVTCGGTRQSAADGAYKNLPRVKAKLEVLKGMVGI